MTASSFCVSFLNKRICFNFFHSAKDYASQCTKPSTSSTRAYRLMITVILKDKDGVIAMDIGTLEQAARLESLV